VGPLGPQKTQGSRGPFSSATPPHLGLWGHHPRTGEPPWAGEDPDRPGPPDHHSNSRRVFSLPPPGGNTSGGRGGPLSDQLFPRGSACPGATNPARGPSKKLGTNPPPALRGPFLGNQPKGPGAAAFLSTGGPPKGGGGRGDITHGPPGLRGAVLNNLPTIGRRGSSPPTQGFGRLWGDHPKGMGRPGAFSGGGAFGQNVKTTTARTTQSWGAAGPFGPQDSGSALSSTQTNLSSPH